MQCPSVVPASVGQGGGLLRFSPEDFLEMLLYMLRRRVEDDSTRLSLFCGNLASIFGRDENSASFFEPINQSEKLGWANNLFLVYSGS